MFYLIRKKIGTQRKSEKWGSTNMTQGTLTIVLNSILKTHKTVELTNKGSRKDRMMSAMIIFLKSYELSLRKQAPFLFKFTFALRSEIIAKLWGQHVEQTKVSFRVRNRLFHGLTFPQQPLWRARSHHAFDFGRQTPEVEKNSLLCKKDFFSFGTTL